MSKIIKELQLHLPYNIDKKNTKTWKITSTFIQNKKSLKTPKELSEAVIEGQTTQKKKNKQRSTKHHTKN